MALRPEGPDDWRARAQYARQKAAATASGTERKAWLAIAHDYEERVRHPCLLRPSANRVRAEIPHVQHMAQGADPSVASKIDALAREMGDVADTLEVLGNRQERKRAK